MRDVEIFKSEEFGEIRTVIIDDEPYFVAKDVAEMLGYKNPRDAIAKLCRGVAKCDIGVQTGIKTDGTPAMQTIEMTVLPERDLYRLIIRSTLPQAEKFEEWVVGTVLPSIRKHGGYMSGQETLSGNELLSKALVFANNVIAEKEKRIQALKDQEARNEHKVEFFDTVADSRDAIDIGSVAKTIGGIGRNALFEFLRDEGVLMKNNQPYQKYIDRGWFRTVEQKYNTPSGSVRINIKTLVFQRGVAAIVRLLKNAGYKTGYEEVGDEWDV